MDETTTSKGVQTDPYYSQDTIRVNMNRIVSLRILLTRQKLKNKRLQSKLR